PRHLHHLPTRRSSDLTFSISLSNPTGASLGGASTAAVTITDNDASTGANPIDQAGFFVTEHYYDFLNRLPDADGLAFWTNEISSDRKSTRLNSSHQII